MQWSWFEAWLDGTPLIWLGVGAAVLMSAALGAGHALRTVLDKSEGPSPADNQESYVVSGILGLVALLMAFSLSLALDRFETRRDLVVQEANTIGTAYLRTQLLAEPQRGRLSGLLIAYLDNRIALARAQSTERDPLMRSNDKLLTDLWLATEDAFESIKGMPFSVGYLESINAVIDLDTSRKAARMARLPTELPAMILVFLLIACAVLGSVLRGRRKTFLSLVLMLFLLLALMMIVDIDRPNSGFIMESQQPMEALEESLKTT